MSGWEVWSTKREGLDAAFPCLRELKISYCPKLINMSLEALPSVRVLEINGCGESVLKSLVQAASSITELIISSISGLTYEVWRGVIEYIRAVEEVRLEHCNEIRYLWESEEDVSKVLVNLKILYLWSCDNLVSLGEKEDLGNFGSNLLSSLRVLYVFDCKNMERCCCPNTIESLEITCCSSLTHVSFSTTGGGGQNLKLLRIYDCEKVMKKINNTSMPMLETLEIGDWRNLKSITQLRNSILLTKLYIWDCPCIELFPELQLSNLTCLSIHSCASLVSFPELSNLTLLKELRIVDCPSIDASFPGGLWPPKLCSLKLGRLKRPISEWRVQNFPTTLVDLELWKECHVSNSSRLSQLLPSSLTRLMIHTFDKLESLSMGLNHLTSLQKLKIYFCPMMKDLPETLPPSLLSLDIYNCPNMEERCNGKGSHYWSLISHIPCIQLDFRHVWEI